MEWSRLRAAGVCVAATAVLALTAAPAQAHGGSLPEAQRYRSTVTGVLPAVNGLDVVLDRTGETLTVTNRTGATVEVPGYTGEPYLRITPTGVEENTNSVSAFLNGSLVIQGLPQELGAVQQPPVWKHVSDTPSYAWHDHRVHWMAQQRPPVVAADPTHPHTVFDWTVPLTVGGTAVTVSGRLVWLGAPAHSTLELTLYVLGATLGLLALGMLAIRLVRAWRPAAGVGTGDGARGGDGGARGGDGGAKGGDGGAKGGDGADSGDDGDSAEGGVAAAGRPSGSAAGVT